MSPVIFALLLAAQEPAAADAAKAPEVPAERIPAGAPHDDFGLVAWCDGVLAGHMDLAERVQAVLPLDPVQQKVGKAYLDAYEKALATSKEGSSKAGKKRAQEARAIGWNNWDKARAADKQLAADTYINWELPGVCEAAAIRLSGDKDLFRMSPTAAEVAAMGESAPLASTQAQTPAQTPAQPEAPPATPADTASAPAAGEAVASAGQTPALETPAAPADPGLTPTAAELGIKTIPDAPAPPGQAAPADAAATPAADAAKTDDPKPADKPKKKGWFDWIPH